MKNLLLILNAILLIAVGYLYYSHFSKCQNDIKVEEVSSNVVNSKTAAGIMSSTILYVNTDSLWNNIEMVKKELDELALEKLKFEGQFKLKAGALEKEFVAFQDKASKGMVSQDEGQRKEAEFMQKQEQLMAYKDELSLKLMEKESESNEKIQKAIYDYLKKHNSEQNYNFVLGYSNGNGAVLFGSDSLDITTEIVEGMNEEYHALHPKKTETK